MELKILEITQLNPVLAWLFHQELGAKLQYYVARNAERVQKEVQRVTEIKRSVIDKYNAEVEDGEVEFPSKEDEEAANKEYQEFMNETVDIELAPLRLEWLEGIELTGEQMVALSKIIEEDTS